MITVAVIDYGASNLRSVVKALEHVSGGRHAINVVSTPEELLRADRIVFPGQGAIGQCMQALAGRGLDEALREVTAEKYFLGLCLGLQALMEFSEEDGGVAGLGILPGRVRGFPRGVRDSEGTLCKIPHMGWDTVHQCQSHPLWRGIADDSRFYFVHSYYVETTRVEDRAGTTDYILPFTCAAARDNLFAVQFHPEKSQRAGLQLLANFLDWE